MLASVILQENGFSRIKKKKLQSKNMELRNSGVSKSRMLRKLWNQIMKNGMSKSFSLFSTKSFPPFSAFLES